MAFTVVPLFKTHLPANTTIAFASCFVLRDLPEWVKRDQSILEGLSRQDRQGIFDAQHALVAEYDAKAIGEPDPAWAGKEPKSIQSTKSDSAILANLALWLVQPSKVCYTTVLHALSWDVPGRQEQVPIIQSTERQMPVYCHPDDVKNVVSVAQAGVAGKLHERLVSVPRDNPVWQAMRAVWAALTNYTADRRYPFFWIGLESLFGPDQKTYGLTKRLARRISKFIASSPAEEGKLFTTVIDCYDMRSEIVHGRWDNNPNIDFRMGETEAILRRVLHRIMNEPNMLTTFLSNGRDPFLQNLP